MKPLVIEHRIRQFVNQRLGLQFSRKLVDVFTRQIIEQLTRAAERTRKHRRKVILPKYLD